MHGDRLIDERSGQRRFRRGGQTHDGLDSLAETGIALVRCSARGEYTGGGPGELDFDWLRGIAGAIEIEPITEQFDPLI
jgi:hypothetical protein